MEHRRRITILRPPEITAAPIFRSDLLVLIAQLHTADGLCRKFLDKLLRDMILVIERKLHHGMHKRLSLFPEMPEYIQNRQPLKM